MGLTELNRKSWAADDDKEISSSNGFILIEKTNLLSSIRLIMREELQAAAKQESNSTAPQAGGFVDYVKRMFGIKN